MTTHHIHFASTKGAPVALCVVCLALALAFPSTAPAQGESSRQTTSDIARNGTVAGNEACPLTTKQYSARVLYPESAAIVGEKVSLIIELEPDEPPTGFYVTTLVDVLSKPTGGKLDILPGVPKTTLTASAAGDYLLEVRINLIAKSSCGGVKATQIGRDRRILHVREAP